MWGDVARRARGHATVMPNAYPGHVVAKAKAAPMGRQPRLGHAAASLDTSYSYPSKERIGKSLLWHEKTLIC